MVYEYPTSNSHSMQVATKIGHVTPMLGSIALKILFFVRLFTITLAWHKLIDDWRRQLTINPFVKMYTWMTHVHIYSTELDVPAGHTHFIGENNIKLKAGRTLQIN